MEKNHKNMIDKMFAYNLWANLQLLDVCTGLTDEQLQVNSDGGFQNLGQTVAHIIDGERYYIRHLTGELPWGDAFDMTPLSMTEIREKAKFTGQRLLEIASQCDPERAHSRILDDGSTQHYFDWTIVLQALYHGIEHRTQAKALLTKLGVSHPEMASWDYTEGIVSGG